MELRSRSAIKSISSSIRGSVSPCLGILTNARRISRAARLETAPLGYYPFSGILPARAPAPASASLRNYQENLLAACVPCITGSPRSFYPSTRKRIATFPTMLTPKWKCSRLGERGKGKKTAVYLYTSIRGGTRKFSRCITEYSVEKVKFMRPTLQ